MIRKLIFILAITSGAAFSEPVGDTYDLLDFLKDPIPESIYKSISLVVYDNKKYVPTCGKESLFTKTLNKNKAKDSLRIKNEHGQEFIIKNKKLIALNSHYVETPYLKSIFKNYLKLKAGSGTFKKLIKKLEESDHITVIKPNNTNNNSARVLPLSKDKACSSIDASLITFFDGKKAYVNLLESCLSRQEVGSSSVVHWAAQGSKQDAFNQISLAHELYHAYDIDRGLLDHRVVVHKQLERESVREYRAVYFENRVRKEMGYGLRHRYSRTSSAGMILNNNPVWIQRPCVGKNSSHKTSITLL